MEFLPADSPTSQCIYEPETVYDLLIYQPVIGTTSMYRGIQTDSSNLLNIFNEI